MSVTSPVLEWSAIQLAAIANPIGRAFNRQELDIIQDIYQGAVDALRVRVVETRILNAPTTLGNQIRVPPGWSFLDNKPVLVHEMGHIWQYQTRGPRTSPTRSFTTPAARSRRETATSLT